MTKITETNNLAGKDNKLSQKHLYELYEQMFGEVGTVNVLQKTSEVVSQQSALL